MPTARTGRRGAKRRSARRIETRRASERAPKVNDAVEIWWAVDKTFYRGTLTKRYHGDTHFRVLYDDGEMEDVNLMNEFWRYADGPTPAPAISLPAPPIAVGTGEDGNGAGRGNGNEIVDEIVLDGSDGPKENEDKDKVKTNKKDKAKGPGASTSGIISLIDDGSTTAAAKAGDKNDGAENAVEEVLAEGVVDDIVVSRPSDRSDTVQPAQNREECAPGKSSDGEVGAVRSDSSNGGVANGQGKSTADAGKENNLEKADKAPSKGKLTKKRSTSETNVSPKSQNGAGAAPKQSALKASTYAPNVKQDWASNLKQEQIAQEDKILTLPSRQDAVGQHGKTEKDAAITETGVEGSVNAKDRVSPKVAEIAKPGVSVKAAPTTKARASITDRRGGDKKVALSGDSDDDVPLATRRASLEAAALRKTNLSAVSASSKPKEIAQNTKAAPSSALLGASDMATAKAPVKRGRGRPRKIRKEESGTNAQRPTTQSKAQKAPNQTYKVPTAPPSSAKQKPSTLPQPSLQQTTTQQPLPKSIPTQPQTQQTTTPVQSKASFQAADDVEGNARVVVDIAPKLVEGSVKSSAPGILEGPGARAGKEDSFRSKSSSEKPPVSFAGKRIKKRKSASLPPPPMATSAGAVSQPGLTAGGQPRSSVVKASDVNDMPKLAEVGSSAGEGAKERGKRSVAMALKVSSDTKTTDMQIGTASGPGGDEARRLSSGIIGSGSDVPLTKSALDQQLVQDVPMTDDAVDVVANSRDEDHRVRERTAPLNDANMHVRKRPRVEKANTASPRASAAAERAAELRGRRLREGERNGSSSGDNVVTDAQLTYALGRLKPQIGNMMEERLTPVQNQVEIITEDVRRLMSVLLSFKQELEVYKDFVRRTVAEEARNSQEVLQDVRMEILSAIEGRARETERKFQDSIKDMTASVTGTIGNGRGEGGDRGLNLSQAGQVAQRRDVDMTSIPGSYPYGDRRPTAYTSSAARVVTDVQETVPSRVGDGLTNGHNESPTAIANVDQGAKAGPGYNYQEARDVGKEFDEPVSEATLKTRVTHLVARQVTVWLLETPHEYNPNAGSVESWADQTAVRTFAKVGEQLMRFVSYTQAYQTLCSSLGNDAVELQWFVSPGIQEHLVQARKNYAAWDPPPSDEEWKGEMVLLKVLGERFSRALERYEARDSSEMEACVAIANLAASSGAQTIT